jgi:hypothetical protein
LTSFPGFSFSSSSWREKGESGTVNYLSPEGIKLILEQPDAKKMSGRSNMVLLSLMDDSGARV